MGFILFRRNKKKNQQAQHQDSNSASASSSPKTQLVVPNGDQDLRRLSKLLLTGLSSTSHADNAGSLSAKDSGLGVASGESLLADIMSELVSNTGAATSAQDAAAISDLLRQSVLNRGQFYLSLENGGQSGSGDSADKAQYLPIRRFLSDNRNSTAAQDSGGAGSGARSAGLIEGGGGDASGDRLSVLVRMARLQHLNSSDPLSRPDADVNGGARDSTPELSQDSSNNQTVSSVADDASDGDTQITFLNANAAAEAKLPVREARRVAIEQWVGHVNPEDASNMVLDRMKDRHRQEALKAVQVAMYHDPYLGSPTVTNTVAPSRRRQPVQQQPPKKLYAHPQGNATVARFPPRPRYDRRPPIVGAPSDPYAGQYVPPRTKPMPGKEAYLPAEQVPLGNFKDTTAALRRNLLQAPPSKPGPTPAVPCYDGGMGGGNHYYPAGCGGKHRQAQYHELSPVGRFPVRRPGVGRQPELLRKASEPQMNRHFHHQPSPVLLPPTRAHPGPYYS